MYVVQRLIMQNGILPDVCSTVSNYAEWNLA